MSKCNPQQLLGQGAQMKFTKKQQTYLLKLLSNCATAAYKDAGYKIIIFDDGHIGVLRANSKLMGTMQALNDHFTVAIGAGKYADKTRKPITTTTKP